MAKVFSKKALDRFAALAGKYPDRKALLLPALRLAEEEFTNIDEDAMKAVAELVGVPPARVLAVVTFYTHFRREGTGKYLLQVCSTLPCSLRGSKELLEHVESRLGIKAGETTKDGKFTIMKVECLGSCGTAPVVQINEDYHEDLTNEKIDRILDGLK